jgi:hypothetical protein
MKASELIKNDLFLMRWENEIKKSLPDNLKSSLPSIEEIEKELHGKN